MEKRKFPLVLPFLSLPIFAALYGILDGALLVKVFGCGCVPKFQANLLNLPFKATPHNSDGVVAPSDFSSNDTNRRGLY